LIKKDNNKKISSVTLFLLSMMIQYLLIV